MIPITILGKNSYFWATAGSVVIGVLAGLIGVGGGEFRLPLLMLLLAIPARAAVPLNLIVSFLTLSGALLIRSATLSPAPIVDYGFVVGGLAVGSVIGAFVAPAFLKHLSDERFGQLLSWLLLLIAGILFLESAYGVASLGLVDPRSLAGFACGVVLGLMIGTIAALLGVAGGEFLIPTLILIYGTTASDAGTCSLAISLVTVTSGLIRYARLGMLPTREVLRSLAIPMGLGSIAGIFLGGLLVPYVSDSWLKAVLAMVLVAAAIKTFRNHRRHPT